MVSVQISDDNTSSQPTNALNTFGSYITPQVEKRAKLHQSVRIGPQAFRELKGRFEKPTQENNTADSSKRAKLHPSLGIGYQAFKELKGRFEKPTQENNTADSSNLISKEKIVSEKPVLNSSETLNSSFAPPSASRALTQEITSTNTWITYQDDLAEVQRKRLEQHNKLPNQLGNHSTNYSTLLRSDSVNLARSAQPTAPPAGSRNRFERVVASIRPIFQENHFIFRRDTKQDIVSTQDSGSSYTQTPAVAEGSKLLTFENRWKKVKFSTSATHTPDRVRTTPIGSPINDYGVNACNSFDLEYEGHPLPIDSATQREQEKIFDQSIDFVSPAASPNKCVTFSNPLEQRQNAKKHDDVINLIREILDTMDIKKADFDPNNIYLAALLKVISEKQTFSSVLNDRNSYEKELVIEASLQLLKLEPSLSEEEYTLDHTDQKLERTVRYRSPILKISKSVPNNSDKEYLIEYLSEKNQSANTLLIAQALGVEEHYLNSWSISDNGFLPKETSNSSPTKSPVKAKAEAITANQHKFLYCTPIKSEGVWDEPRGEKRGTKFKALESVYRKPEEELNSQKNEIKETIENTLLCIIAKIAENPVITTSLGKTPSINDIIKLIEAAQNNGGISNKLKEDGNYEKQKEAIEPWKNKFSKLFQEECKACGIYSGRNTATTSHGMRLTHLPLSALNKLKDLSQEHDFKISSLADSVDLEEKKDLVRKKIIPQTHYTQSILKYLLTPHPACLHKTF